jgi:chromosome segregation ATPase
MTVSYQTDAGIYDVEALRASVMDAQKLVAAAKAEWQRVITDSKILFSADIATDIANKSLAVDQAQKEVQDARQAIDDANTAIATAQNALDDATLAVDDAKTAVDDAKKSISDAQKSLDKALVKSTEIVAQFDGFITQVNATGG